MSVSPYLDLLKRCLLNEVYLDDELRLLYLRRCLAGEEAFDFAVYHNIRTARAEDYARLRDARAIGQFFERNIHNAGFSHTMIGRQRLDGLHDCLERILAEGIPGDLMECGVWRGGACVLMAGVLKDHGITDRKVILADSFDGIPPSSMQPDAHLRLDKSVFPELAVSLEEVKTNFELYGLLSHQVHFLKGWFKETLQETPSAQLALLRLDGDLYESTMDALVALYDRVSPGGIVIIDDWGVLPPCRQAVEDYFAGRGEVVPEIQAMDWSGVWFKKPGEPAGVERRSYETAFPAPFLKGYQAGTLGYSYRGVPCLKSPIDLALYAKALWELKPATLIEIGSKAGGSALWFADLLHSYGLQTPVYSIDLQPPQGIDDARITFLQGDVNELAACFSKHGLLQAPRPWLVTEDSAHTYQACSAALAQLAEWMQTGDLLVMEDGVLDHLGLSERYDGGPNRALQAFFSQHPDVFRVDRALCDLFGRNATYAPNAWLWKI